MTKVRPKINTILIINIIILLFMIIYNDTETLNSLAMNEEDTFLIAEVNTYQPSEETSSPPVATEENNSTPVLLNKTVATDDWAWPTNSNYIITSYFGYRWGSMHDAIDISGPGYGSNIYAANNGTVAVVKGGCIAGDTYCNGRGGNYIIINHNYNNYYTIYMHLKDIYVYEGQVVTKGQVIGTMGNTGNVIPVPTANSPYNGTHLHFGLYIGQPYNGGYAVNPMRLY